MERSESQKVSYIEWGKMDVALGEISALLADESVNVSDKVLNLQEVFKDLGANLQSWINMYHSSSARSKWVLIFGVADLGDVNARFDRELDDNYLKLHEIGLLMDFLTENCSDPALLAGLVAMDFGGLDDLEEVLDGFIERVIERSCDADDFDGDRASLNEIIREDFRKYAYMSYVMLAINSGHLCPDLKDFAGAVVVNRGVDQFQHLNGKPFSEPYPEEYSSYYELKMEKWRERKAKHDNARRMVFNDDVIEGFKRALNLQKTGWLEHMRSECGQVENVNITELCSFAGGFADVVIVMGLKAMIQQMRSVAEVWESEREALRAVGGGLVVVDGSSVGGLSIAQADGGLSVVASVAEEMEGQDEVREKQGVSSILAWVRRQWGRLI